MFNPLAIGSFLQQTSGIPSQYLKTAYVKKSLDVGCMFSDMSISLNSIKNDMFTSHWTTVSYPNILKIDSSVIYYMDQSIEYHSNGMSIHKSSIEPAPIILEQDQQHSLSSTYSVSSSTKNLEYTKIVIEFSPIALLSQNSKYVFLSHYAIYDLIVICISTTYELLINMSNESLYS